MLLELMLVEVIFVNLFLQYIRQIINIWKFEV